MGYNPSTAGTSIGTSSASGTVTAQYGGGGSGLVIGIVGGLIGENGAGGATATSGNSATGSVTSSLIGNQQIGGLVGTDSSSSTSAIVNSYYTTGTVGYTGAATSGFFIALGGLVGDNAGGSITGTAGSPNTYSYSTATMSYSGTATPTTFYIGGLAGYNAATITYAYATGPVTYSGSAATADVGGLAGYNSGAISHIDTAPGSVSATSAANGSTILVGGLVGANSSGTITSVSTTSPSTVTGNSTVTGTNTNSFYMGGLVGQNGGTGTITGSSSSENVTYNYNNITTSGTSTVLVGGLVGYNPSTAATSVGNSAASGTVTAQYGGSGSGKVSSEVGGLIGQTGGSSTTTVTSGNFAAGNVTDSMTGSAESIGGLIGYNHSTSASAIVDSYATGAVTGTSSAHIGGLVGDNITGTISTSYATGYVQSVGTYGGLVGVNTGTVANTSYWDSGTTGQANSAGSANGNGVSTATLQAALQTGWSGVTWSIIAGTSYPYLAWEATGPQVVSGIAYSDHGATVIADGAVSGLIGGSALASIQTGGSVTTGANGYYYYLIAPSTISGGGSQVLTYLPGGTKGEAFSDNATTSVSGLNIYGNYLKISSAGTTLSGMTADLSTALGGNSGANFPFTITSGALAMTSGVNLELDPTAASTSLDKTLTVSGAGLLLLNDANTVTQTAAITTPNLLLLGTGGTYTLTSSSNNIAKVAANTGNVNLDDTPTSGLTVGAISGTTGITTTGSTTLVSLGGSGSLTLTSGDGITAGGGGNSIVLADSTTFTNSDGSGALTPGGGGSFLVWSINPASDNRGSLVYNFKQYNATYGVTSVAGSGNGFLYTLAPTISATLTGTATKTYDGTTAATITGAGYSGVSGTVDSDSVTAISNLTSGTYDTATSGSGKTVTAGGATITASNGGKSVYGYQASVNGTIGTINKAPLTVTALGQEVTYATNVPSTTVSYSGFVNSESTANLTTAPTASSTLSGIQNAGTYVGNYTASGGVATNYSFSYVAGNLTVDKAHLTVTANDNSRLYGAADPSFTDTITGFVNGQNSGVVSGSATNTTPGTDIATSAAGSTYAITPTLGSLTASNYDFTVFTPGTLTVNKAHLTVTADDQSRLYGAADPSFTDTITGFVNGQNSGVVSGSASNTTPGTDIATSVAGSTYAITPTLGSLTASNYDFTVFTPGTLTVGKAHLTVTADDASRLYGAADPSFTDTISGFVNGQNSGVVSGSASNTTPGGDTVASAAGSTYAITPTLGSLTASNYDFTVFTPGTLTVNKAHLTVTADDASRLYGAADPSFTDTISGFVNGQNSGVVSGSASNTTPGGDTVASAAGSTYAITPTLGSLTASNYDFTVFTPGTLTVGKAHLTVTANDNSRLYGAADPSFTDTISGFVNGQNSGVVSGSASNTTPGGDTVASVAGSTYAITPTLGSLTASNYDFTVFTPGTLTVGKAHLTVTADDTSRLYGAADPSFTDTITGFVNGQNSGVVSGSATNTTPGTDIATSAAGSTYAITPTLGSLTASNYDFTTFNAGTLTVGKAHLTVTANDNSRLYDAADPSFTDTISGFMNGQNSGVVSGSATNTTPGGDTVTSAAGSTYAITPTLGSLTASNYDFTVFTPGTLTVGKAHLTVTADDQSRLYGAADPSFTDTISGFVNGQNSGVVSGSASNTTPGTDIATSAAGSTYAITPTLGSLTASNYDFTTFNAGTLTVLGAPQPVVTISQVDVPLQQVIALSSPVATSYDPTTSDETAVTSPPLFTIDASLVNESPSAGSSTSNSDSPTIVIECDKSTMNKSDASCDSN